MTVSTKREEDRKPEFRVDGLDHVEFFVPSRYEAAKWYRNALGLSIVNEAGAWAKHPGGPLMVSSHDFQSPSRTMLALFRGEPRGDRPTAGFHRVAFRVDGPGFLRGLEYLGHLPVFDEAGEPLERLVPVDHNTAFSAYFCDPWGHRLELTSYDIAPIRAAL